VEAANIVTFRGSIMNFGLRHAGFFEPFAPYGISYYVKGKLKEFKNQGRISAYKTRTKRLGKWHYMIEITADLTTDQIASILSDLHNRLGF
jgi:hypothetical protein